MAGARDILINLLGKETVSPAAGKAGTALDKMGDQAEDAARDAKKLDREIEDLNQSLRGLAAAYAAAGTAAERADITKAIRVDQRQLREKLKVKDLLQDAGGEAAGGFATGFVGRLGPLVVSKMPAALSPAVVAGAAGPAAVLAVTLGTAVAGGIIGAAGASGVVGGLAIAAKHPAVQAEAKSLGADIGRALERAAEPMVPATIDVLKIIRGKFHEAEGDIKGIFAAAAEFAPVLAEGAGEGIKSVIRGIRELAQRADPVIDAIADGFREIGHTIGEGLGDLVDNANEGAQALHLVFEVVEVAAAAFLKLADGAAETYGWMTAIAGVLRGDPGPLIKNLYEDAYEAQRAGRELTETQNGLIGGFHLTAEAARQAAQATRDYAEANRTLTDQNLSVAESTVRYKEAILAARDAVDKKKKVSLEEEGALLAQARASNTLIESLDRQGASAAVLSDKHRIARKELIDTALRMGYTEAQAQRLADQYLATPRQIDTLFTADTDQAARNLRDVRDLIARIKSKRVVITVDVRGRQSVRSEGRNVPIGDLGGREHGGPVKAGHAYVVGEKRPEVFVPDRDGKIIPSVEKYNSMTGRANGGAGIDYDRLGRAVARHMEGLTLRIDDRGGRIAAVRARSG